MNKYYTQPKKGKNRRKKSRKKLRDQIKFQLNLTQYKQKEARFSKGIM